MPESRQPCCHQYGKEGKMRCSESCYRNLASEGLFNGYLSHLCGQFVAKADKGQSWARKVCTTSWGWTFLPINVACSDRERPRLLKQRTATMEMKLRTLRG